ncbi:uncharacterized protein LOC133318488 [Gastrolobium bilobum]|uniref:uncharacterized protein LOC133318488 n=1 Tax=Gastrolobium bilobum TaxID=150636 RepID=UPI002AB26E05|nr:uncharacterized protein LOC133318488 [Gastrolobium bilobum]
MERQPARSIATWDDLSTKFFAEFFSMERYNQMVNDITNFTQTEGETLCAAWNRFKDLMRRCPHYNLTAGDQVRMFFNGITPEDRMVLNGAAGVINPKEDCMAIITRSGKVVAPLKNPILDYAEEEEKHDGAVEPEVEVEERPVVVEKKHELSPEYVRSKAPYPERFKKEAYNKQYGRSFGKYAGYSKFMKDLLSRKHKLQECQTVTLTEKCSAFIQQKIPAKLSDPGSFNIPIAIGNIGIGRALCDLGASINLMPFSVYKSLGIEELKPTEVSLQLADRSVRTPNGIIEDVLVKVDKFIFPADFVVLDMEEGSGKPLLLGRPFLATARALIDVEQGMIKLRMNN